jgi:hypothetical protein
MKARTTLWMSAAIALLASCSADRLTDAPPAPETGAGRVHMKVTVGQETTSHTRIVYGEDGSDPVGMTAQWSTTGEYLGVISYKGETGDVGVNRFDNETDMLQGTYNPEKPEWMTFEGYPQASTGVLEGKYSFFHLSMEGFMAGHLELDVDTMKFHFENQLCELEEVGGNRVGSPDNLNKCDVLYTEKAIDPNRENIVLKRGSVILRFVLTLPAGTPVIDHLELRASAPVFYEQLNLKSEFDEEGTAFLESVKPTSSLRLNLKGDGGTAARTITAYMVTAPGADLSGQRVRVSAVATDKTIYSYTYTHVFTGADRFESGKTYTFSATLAKDEERWAASNIYWDAQHERLTFDVVETPDGSNQYYQGVFFKWGSLVGISPDRTNEYGQWDGNVVIYYPKYDYFLNEYNEGIAWYHGAASGNIPDYTNYGDIPYEQDLPDIYGRDQDNLYYSNYFINGDKWDERKGDICRFLGEIGAAPQGYRMPRSEEFGEDDDWAYGAVDDTSDETIGGADGKKNLFDKAWGQWTATGRYFPAAGFRFPDGMVDYVGNTGSYWSSSAFEVPGYGYSGYDMYIVSHDVFTSNRDDRQFAFSVRCIRD